MKARTFIGIAAVILALLFQAGCATQDDLRHVSRSTDAKIAAVQENLSGMDRSLRDDMAQIRKNQADLGADMIAFRDEIQRLRGVQEDLQVQLKEGAAPLGAQAAFERIEARLLAIERRLGMPDAAVPDDAPTAERPADRPRDSETMYSDAYGLFKDGKYDAARKGFLEFIKSFPETEYSDNARFWIGESYYFEGKYEEAILEYQKVIQDYPQGSRVPHALLKQALSFERLGEKASATLLLQRVLRDFPGTTPAESARAKLLEMR